MAGLKSLAQELQSKGRYGDTILAHINPQEAGILKALGGSGTINPDTGLPEYWGVFKSITQPFVDVWKGITNLPIIKDVSDAVTPVLQSVAPYAPYIAPFIPGIGPLLAAGIGAAGAGFGSGKGGFNLKRGLMGGLTAYGLGNLYAGLQAAATAGTAPTAVDVASSLGVEGASSAPGSQAAMLAEMTGPGFGSTGGVASSASYANPATNFIGSAAESGAQALAANAPNAGMVEASANSIPFDQSLATSVPQSLQIPNLSSMPANFATEMGNAGSGLKNLAGLGEGTMSEAAKAVGTKFGTGSAAATLTGIQGMAALDEEQKYLDQQLESGNIAQAEYNAGIARINESRARSEQAMRNNPYQFYAGGDVEYGAGDQVMGYSMGGQPRFLSGGGDGMSDSIKANIEGKQEARLADGEFVVPADVVSHLGNGSSKAGAKQLYSMMDRVRSARTGKKSQGKQINPRNYMAA